MTNSSIDPITPEHVIAVLRKKHKNVFHFVLSQIQYLRARKKGHLAMKGAPTDEKTPVARNCTVVIAKIVA